MCSDRRHGARHRGRRRRRWPGQQGKGGQNGYGGLRVPAAPAAPAVKAAPRTPAGTAAAAASSAMAARRRGGSGGGGWAADLRGGAGGGGAGSFVAADFTNPELVTGGADNSANGGNGYVTVDLVSGRRPRARQPRPPSPPARLASALRGRRRRLQLERARNLRSKSYDLSYRRRPGSMSRKDPAPSSDKRWVQISRNAGSTPENVRRSRKQQGDRW